MESALIARGTGAVRIRSWVPDLDCQRSIGSVASGQLTSDSRLVTAHHAVNALDSDGASGKPILVSFETEYINDSDDWANKDLKSKGVFVNDYRGPEPPQDESGYDFDRWDTKKGEEHENPLLANRLFALGMERWAREDSTFRKKRDQIRTHWPFEIDGTRSQQSSAFSLGTGCHRRDVMVLKAKAHTAVEFSSDPGSDDYLESGAFPLIKPGVFFNSQPFEVEERCPKDETMKLYLLHHNFWPDDDNEEGSDSENPDEQEGGVPLVSNPGYTDQWTPSVHTEGDFCKAYDQKVNCTYEEQIRTTLDARKGSSGGAMLHGLLNEECKTEGDDLVATGVLSGITGNFEWGTAYCTRNEPCDCDPDGGNCDTSEGPEQPEDFYTKIQTASEDLEYWSRRDIDFGGSDPFNPTPDQPPNWPNLQAQGCAEENEAGDCIRWQTYKPEPDSGQSAEDFGVPWAEPTPINEESSEFFLTRQCGHYSQDWGETDWDETALEPRAGLAIGFLGAATSPVASESQFTGIGHLQMICAPYSDAPFTNNWGFLTMIGRNVQKGEDVIRGGRMNSHFRSTLKRNYEVRDLDQQPGGTVAPRPVSFKTCPPNYYLRGLVFSLGARCA